MIEAYLTETAVYRAIGIKDKWGVPSASTDLPIKCRPEWRFKQVINKMGQVDTAQGVAMLDFEPSLDNFLVIDGVQYSIIGKAGAQDGSDTVSLWEAYIK